MKKILSAPQTVLSTPSKKVGTIDSAVKKLLKDLEQTLVAQTDPQGVGLAAPQIGVGFRIFIMRPAPKDATQFFINPRIIQTVGAKKVLYRPKGSSNKKRGNLEGCLSVPRIWSPVKRPHRVLLEWVDEKGNKKKQWFSGFKAVIVQHEVDHLDGILFTQRALEQGVRMYEEVGGKLKRLQE